MQKYLKLKKKIFISSERHDEFLEKNTSCDNIKSERKTKRGT